MLKLRNTLLLLAVMLISFPGNSQDDIKTVSQQSNIMFFGIDYSELKLIHEEGFVNKNGTYLCESLTFKYFVEWNEMFLIERNKFNLSKYFSIENYDIDNSIASKRNEQYQTDNCISNDENYTIQLSKIKGIVNEYISDDYAQKIGLIILGESMSKKLDRAKYHCVFFEISTGKIVFIDKVEGPPAGYGIRNYWINSLHEALLQRSKFYKKSRKQYN